MKYINIVDENQNSYSKTIEFKGRQYIFFKHSGLKINEKTEDVIDKLAIDFFLKEKRYTKLGDEEVIGFTSKSDLESNKAVDKNSKVVNKNSKAVDKNSKVVDKNSKVVDKNSKVVDKNSKVVNKNSKVVNKNSKVVDTELREI